MGSEEEVDKEVGIKNTKMENNDKNEKKRKHEEEDGEKSSKKLSKEDRKALKAQQKAEKAAALEKVPRKDENGIAYTSLQIKRMTKRVIRGLPPVPTEQEENERIHRLRQEERETQDELAGMLFNKDDEKDEDAVDDDDDASGNDDVKDNTEPDEDVEEDDKDDDKDDVEEETKESANTDSKPQKKKARSKPVPADYVCFACKNAQNPLHWIYDCPDKIRNPGTNLIKKKQRGVFDPSSRKVFVTGLPFEAKSKEVEAYFENEMKCGKVVYCKLLLFEDSKRCRGNGFVTFDTDEGAQKALELNGATSFSIGEQDEKGKKELKLGVKKVLNRTQTNKRTYSKR